MRAEEGGSHMMIPNQRNSSVARIESRCGLHCSMWAWPFS